MVSTYLSFDLVNRDMVASLKRISSQTQVANEQAYYQENIGKVDTLDDFLDNYRLYSFAMTAHGLEDMIYAKAFMKQVLESDLSDDNSFANRLTDERYKNFAAAFNFGAVGKDAAVAQSDGQMEDIFDLYDERIEQLGDKTEEGTRYFKAMFGTAANLKSVDEFLHNEKLREYVFTAYGIDGAYYNYAAVRGSLTSDLNDPDSYFNTTYGQKLDEYNTAKTEYDELAERISERDAVEDYRESIALGQEQNGKYEQQIADKQEEIDNGGDEEKLQAEIDALREKIEAVNELIARDQAAMEQSQARFDELDAKLVPIDQTTSRRAELAKVLNATSSNVKFYEQMKKLAEDFQFNADGSVPASGALSAAKIQEIVGTYFTKQERVTHAEAMFNQEYFESKIGTITNVDDLLADSRIYKYLRSAFSMDEAFVVPSTLEQILTSDLSDPTSYANFYGKDRPQYLELAKAFNFGTDGTVAAGEAQTTAQTTTTRNNYMSRWDDKQEESLEKSIKFYKTDMASIESLDDFLSNAASTTYEFALSAVGIDPDSVSRSKIRRVLQSDLSDPNSFVYQQKDERLVSLAKLFNFDGKGEVTVAVLAQSNTAITTVASDYILRKTRFLEGEAKEAAKTKAEEEAKYYTDAMQRLDTRDELLKDRKLLDILFASKGMDPETITDDFIEKIFTSDLSDPESYVNKLDDKRFAQIVGTFNFDEDGEIDRSKAGGAQNGGEVSATLDMYLRQMLETEQGNDNPGVRLALYFERLADTITDPYVILGDDALAEFFRITFSLPSEFSNLDVDKQAAVVEKNLNLEDLADPEKLRKLVERFTMMYDIENATINSPAVSILGGNGGQQGISADTLWALSQLSLR